MLHTFKLQFIVQFLQNSMTVAIFILTWKWFDNIKFWKPKVGLKIFFMYGGK